MSQKFKNVSPLRAQKEEKLKTFLVAAATATIIFVPFMIMGGGYFLFYGDFNVQQIPFYQMCHEMVRGGNVAWNWNTDLGVNFIGSYSFYLLGSPFFWLTLLFPSWMIPYLMGPIYILKFALAALTAYLFIRRFTRQPRTAMLASLLYAFSGFSIYNVFFNHFHEAIIFFPLLLLGLELFITENKRGVFALSVFICAISNYFFFFGMVVFAAIYFIVRVCSGCYSLKFKRFLWLVFEAIIGLLMAAVILVPTFYAIIQNSRIDNIIMGWNGITYGKEQIYLNIIQCFFFPPDLPARPVFFPGAEVKWSSLGGWLPVFSMVGVIAFMQSKKGSWLRRIIAIMILMSMVPILNSAFYMFNTEYYARWFYMPILMMCLSTAMALEDRAVDFKPAYKWTVGITIAITLIIGLFPQKTDDDTIRFGLFNIADENAAYTVKFWITCAISIVSLIIFGLLMSQIRKDYKAFLRAAIPTVCAVSIIYSLFFIGMGKQLSYNNEVMIDHLIEGQIDLPDNSDNYRVDVFSGVDNTGMYLGLPCINSFHSIVPGSITEFYQFIGEERGVASRPTVETYAARNMLSVKYLLNRLGGDAFETDKGLEMPDYSYYQTSGGYRIYENANYIPYGFTYDYYVTRAQCETFSKKNRANLMLKAIVLDEDQIRRHNDILKNLGTDYDLGDISEHKSREQLLFNSNEAAYDSAERAASAAISFNRDNGGFTSSVSLEEENLVFFSVPYEEGWSATVNGKSSVIEKVNIGFMAVRVPQGESVIRFNYTTPGLKDGILITIASTGLLFIYLMIYWVRKKLNPRAFYANWPEKDKLVAMWAKQDLDASLATKKLDDLDDDFFDEIDANSDVWSQSRYKGGFNVDSSVLNTSDIALEINDFARIHDTEGNDIAAKDNASKREE